DRPLSEVTPESVLSLHEGRSNATYNRMMALIRAAMRIAHRNGWIAAVPHFHQLPEPVLDTQPLTQEEWQRLRAELPEHLRDLAEFALATGLRFSNVSQLEWAQLDEEKGMAWVPAGRAKARKSIGVPLSDAALEVLSRRPKDTPWVFTYEGRPVW